MQSKALILLLTGLVAAVSGAAAPANEVEIIEESTGPLNARQADITWQATGGCKTDWANRCNAACRGEASQRSYSCASIKSRIWRQSCVFGWSVCDCTCVR
ncbi:Putative protein of unknown function [Podospora comata]|uniref:Uncharacterized protein n=1 Tax=Podospora comata TaxID=48703 RepID=A0ABY6SHT4_PODCO|nr:Putative protein of unknown function [Podospora comata]